MCIHKRCCDALATIAPTFCPLWLGNLSVWQFGCRCCCSCFCYFCPPIPLPYVLLSAFCFLLFAFCTFPLFCCWWCCPIRQLPTFSNSIQSTFAHFAYLSFVIACGCRSATGQQLWRPTVDSRQLRVDGRFGRYVAHSFDLLLLCDN